MSNLDEDYFDEDNGDKGFNGGLRPHELILMDENLIPLYKEKLRAQIKKFNFQIQKELFALEKKQSKFMTEDEIEKEMLLREMALRAGIQASIKKNIKKLIKLINGDQRKKKILEKTILTDFEPVINHYARELNQDVILDKDIFEPV